MKVPRFIAATVLIAGAALASTALASHVELLGNVTFKNGPEVTKKCIECHEKETKDFMKTVHWTWVKEQKVKGKTYNIGKINALNNFCIGLPANWPRCTSCHAGYGWKDASFDFKKAENVDCLVCHDTTGTYKKFPTRRGAPGLRRGKEGIPQGQGPGSPSTS